MATANRTRRKGDRLSELHEELSEGNQFVDLCLVFRRKTTGEVLLKVGGRWDKIAEDWCADVDAGHCHVINVKENQVAIVQKFRLWLERYLRGERRERILLTGGARRGGKSFITSACIVAIAIAVPEAICWMVSPTILKRDELERYVKRHSLQAWRTYRGMPEYRFTLVNGSVIQSITGDTYDALKRGQATAILYNEPQDMAVEVATNGLPALIDQGGLGLFAGNPATRSKGYWFNELRQVILDGEYVWEDGSPKGSFFDVPSKENDAIDQSAREDFGQLLHILNPEAAKRDDGGLWLHIGELAYEMWRRKPRLVGGDTLPALVGELPDIGFTDITSEALRQVGVWRSSGRQYLWAIGGDFQGRPHMAALAGKVLKGPDGRRYYYFRHEFIAKGDEADLSDEIVDRGECSPDNAVFIGDSSGDWQAGKDRKRKIPSWEALNAHRWTVIPPREKIRPDSKHAANPPVDLSVGQMFIVMRESRILVHPDCKWLIESFEKCPVKREGSRLIIPSTGAYSHITDCARYFVWRFEPKPKRAPNPAAPRGASFPHMRPGAGFRY